MKKAHFSIASVSLLLLSLGGCDAIGAKATSMSIIYAVTTALSLLLLIGYCTLLQKKNSWFTTLCASVFIVNSGYFALSISTTLEEALLANRIAYLGSVMLPLSMLMIIRVACNIKYHKAFIGCLIAVSIAVFIVAASPGYLDIYYKTVTLETVGGVSVLNKEYGSWHCVYLFYLLGYFATMVATITYAVIKKKTHTGIKAIVLAVAVFVNIGVWLLEQLVKIDFEFLSVSYIVSELFLLSIYLLEQENEFLHINYKPEELVAKSEKTESEAFFENAQDDKQEGATSLSDQCRYFIKQLPTLTATEKNIYNMHIDCKSTKEILEALNIKENTLKYHNRNLYSKLGVSSKKELREIANSINTTHA